MSELKNIFHLKVDSDYHPYKCLSETCFFINNNDSDKYSELLYNTNKISKIIYKKGILTPKVLKDGYMNSIYELIPFQENIPADHLDQLTEALNKLYSIKTKKFGPFEDSENLTGFHGKWESFLLLNLGYHLDYLFENNLIDKNEYDKIFSKIVEFCSWQQFSFPVLLHGDLGPQNIKFFNDKLYLIDWDDAISGDPLYDLANWATFEWFSCWDEEYINNFIGKFNYGYNTEKSFWTYFLRISILKMIILHKKGIKNLDRAKNRINRALYIVENYD